MKELELIYQVARLANVPAETHEQVKAAVMKLAEQLKPKEEQKKK